MLRYRRFTSICFVNSDMKKQIQTSSKIEKITIPGVDIYELLELQEIFPLIRKKLAYIMIPVVCVAQIRVALFSMKSNQIQRLNSVNWYFRNFLAKSEPLLYVTAAIAIRRTIGDYAAETDFMRILSDHKELCSNLEGPVNMRGGIYAALGDPMKLRAYRRGIMAQVTGQFQTIPIYYPRKLVKDIELISTTDYLSRLPFETTDINFKELVDDINRVISPNENPLIFVDQFCVPKGKVFLEEFLNIIRKNPHIPDISKVPQNLSNLPTWKRLAILQAQRLSSNLKDIKKNVKKKEQSSFPDLFLPFLSHPHPGRKNRVDKKGKKRHEEHECAKAVACRATEEHNSMKEDNYEN